MNLDRRIEKLEKVNEPDEDDEFKEEWKRIKAGHYNHIADKMEAVLQLNIRRNRKGKK